MFDDNPDVATTVFLQEDIAGVKDVGFEQQFRATEDQLESYGLNARWEINDSFTVNLDGHLSNASSDPDAPNGASSTLVSIGAPVIASHSVDPSSLTGAFNEASPVRRLLISIASRSGTTSSRATASATSCVSPALSPPSLLMARLKPKNSFRCADVVPILTSERDRRMYSWIAALIHHSA